MIIPAIIGYLCGNFQFGLLVATGTLAHIYVFKGPSRSKLRTVIICNLAFAICMMLGTLTAKTPLVFGMTLLIVTVIPFYIFTALKIAGPSSTFFIVTFSLPINLPIAPEEALYRGFAILVGGILATMMVLITIVFSKNKAEEQAIQNDFKLISKLLHTYNDKSAFLQVAKTAVDSFKASDKLLITSTSSNDKLSRRFQKLLLLHTSAQGIYSELLELNAKQIRPLPDELIEMMDHIIAQLDNSEENVRYWRKEVTVTEEFQNLFNHILKIDEMVHANEARIAYEADMRKPLYSKRIYQNLTLDSIVFRNTLRYTAIMMIAIFIALMFDFEKAYWIPLSAHTILLGTSTIHAIERGMARGLGTILGVLVLSVILLFSIPTPVAVIFITIQVILMNGLASQNLTINIAFPRVIDVAMGIVIAIIGLFVLGQRTASALLPNVMAEVVRKEATLFHYLFSENQYKDDVYQKNTAMNLSVKLNNMTQVYNAANGELFSDKTLIQNYYPSLFALEEISFMLNRAMANEDRLTINEQLMGEYLAIFENIAKHFELNTELEIKILPDLPQYNYIQSAMMNIQHNGFRERDKNV
ncbi:Putative Probable membrane protein [Staphylococcus aureus]|uniref:FUSC family protein n=1 Tax=Staphylococcus aureus TaxID=1280 RepID=UPI0005DCEEBD|nr:FUSC family protein [Staphylococcus aureus]CEZ61865.1 Putative Probable membrane protein [Staphylococcus aureus]CMT16859.1 Putative Probable membrane protein [Staphylococcus aureus]CMT20007.1 Putative Probable membrane protein [Staphylococcus aureus]CMT28012.1 Putative Probable membrane protein [Staphylococcus aureus]CMT33926.1 Putative Probable membrane protein [Staphylococcus aureus]